MRFLARKRTALAVVLALTLGTGGCAELVGSHEFTLQVSGLKGTRITGEYILTANGETSRHKLDQEVPFTIQVAGADLSCVVQKLGDAGIVRAQLSVDGRPVAFSSTRERYGNVTVSTP